MSKLPLAVDLDGTLVNGDIFLPLDVEEAQAHAVAAAVVAVVADARACTRQAAGQALSYRRRRLPYEARVLDWLRIERASGRAIVLATACSTTCSRRTDP